MNYKSNNKEQDRLDALKSYHLLDTVEELEYDRITKLASIICEVPISTITLIDETRQWFKSKVGLDSRETAREISFCQHAILDTQLFTIPDALLDHRFKDNPLVTSDPRIRFYAGYPLIDPSGHALGTICVIDRIPRVLTEAQEEALKILSEEIMALILNRRRNNELNNFEKLFNFSSDLICIAGSDGHFKKINPAFAQKLGFDEEYLVTTPFWEMIHPDDLEITRKEILKLSKGKLTINFKNRFITKNKNYIYLEWVASPEKDTGLLFAIARDVTSENEKEEQLLISETRFRNFFESSQGLMCTHDLAGNFLTVNKSGASLLGYTVEEILNKNLKDIIPSQFHDALKAYLDEVSSQGKASGKMFTNHKNGEAHIWMFSNTLYTDDKNQKYVIGNSIDITEQHYLELDLAKQKERLENTNKLAKVGAWEVNYLSNEVYWGKLTKRIHEVDQDYKPSFENVIEFYEGVNKIKILKIFEESMSTGNSFDIEIQIRTAKGKDRWVRVQGNPEMRDGKCVRIYGAFQDIDDRKRVELEIQKSRKLFNDVLKSATELSIIATDTNGTITLFNAGAEEMLGYKAEEVVEKASPSIIHDKDELAQFSEYIKQKYNKVVQGFELFTVEANEYGSFEKEWTYICKNKKRILVSLVISPIYDVDDTIIGYLGIASDITEKRRQRDELEKAKVLAEQASIAKSEFLANMSHEIRTPLNGVIGFTDLVLRTNLNETQEQYISIVNQSANSLLGIINDILDFSKIEAGKLELDIDRCDLFDIASQATDIITFQAHSKNLEVLLNISTSLPRYVYTDNIRLKQIMVNLLGNAVKFTNKGEIELKINALEKIDSEHILFRIQVKDTGIGIHPDKLEKIFEAFAQEDSSTTKKYGGTGLGLSISNKLLAMMGSKLNVDSTLGSGSTFYFDVKLKVEYDEQITWSNANEIKNVLIVDDNVNNRLILHQMLALNKITTTEAANGIEAIKILSERNNFDVIIMDYHMPYMDGIETIKKIRENFQSSKSLQPIILLYSSSDDESIIKACEEYKVNYRLVKPIKMNDLYQAFNNLDSKHGRLKENSEDEIILNQTNPKILIAEDNTVNMLLSKTLVKKVMPNAEILEAKTGIDTIRLFKEHQPAFIFMDIQMPEMNGYEATQAIRGIEQHYRVPIVALTAGNVKGEKEKCLSFGMDDFIVKPITQHSIYEVLHKHLVNHIQPSDVVEHVTESKSHFNKNIIRNLVDHNESMVEEVLTQLTLELNSYKIEINKQLKELSISTCKSLAHKIYGMANSIGMDVLAEMAREMELEKFSEEEMKEKLILLNTEIELLLNLI
jgi:PAS domain S-box-containing protein